MARKRKIGIIIGTRPQFVKLFPLLRECNARLHQLSYFIIHTGQHFDPEMSEDFLQQLNISDIQYHLNIHSLPEGEMLGKTIDGIENIVQKERPDMMVVFGDSRTTLAGALASKYSGFPCTHIEAGLRSFDLSMPEEVNRIATDSICDLLCCPTRTTIKNLASASGKVIFTGDIMLDAFRLTKTIPPTIKLGKYVLFTAHRKSLMDSLEHLTEILKAVNHIDHHILKVIAPLHPNCKNKIRKYGLDGSFVIIPPQGYLQMKSLVINAQLIITDSGGLQKEAFFAGKNCVTLRENTEWIETLKGGHNVLAGYNYNKIISSVQEQMSASRPTSDDLSVFGDGRSAGRIVDAILDFLDG